MRAGAILYGSRARGTHRPDSDADVLVLLRGEHRRFVTTKLELVDLAYDVLLSPRLLPAQAASAGRGPT